MAETLLQFQTPVTGPDGTVYRTRACGAPTADALWQGWIEFTPLDGAGPVLRSGRETTQPNRRDLLYWATGLSPVYLEGALRRALEGPVTRPAEFIEPPAFEGPRPAVLPSTAQPPSTGRAVLDPFSVYEKGEVLLRKQLAALSLWHLVNIISEYRLSDRDAEVLGELSQAALIEMIVDGVKARLEH